MKGWRAGGNHTDSGLSFWYLGELDNTAALRSCTVKQDLGELDLTSSLE
jgi:hypothetical protein